MAIYGTDPNTHKVHEFDTLDDALEYFGNHFSYKYDILWCYIAGKLSCIIGSSMAEDYEYVGDINSAIERWLTPCKDIATEGITTDATSELRDKLYDLIEDWGIADIYYYTDTF